MIGTVLFLINVRYSFSFLEPFYETVISDEYPNLNFTLNLRKLNVTLDENEELSFRLI